jgi:CubicO group peptidase (beta-lactamase class C family)
METRQFRRLYEEFLFRMVELETLSADARGDLSKLFGQFAALLIFLSILFALPAFGLSGGSELPQVRLMLAWSGEHFLIATTMLVTGLFAVLRWDSTYPDKRDVLVLAPLPVRARTIFLAKIAGVGTSLVLAIVALHAAAGLVWPICLNTTAPAHLMPRLTTEPASPPIAEIEMFSTLDRDVALGAGDGIAIGISRMGKRRVFALGTAKPDSIFQIGSITKTFTGLALAQMAASGQAGLEEPVRELLPTGTISRPAGREITLLDLVTHRSGLPPFPANLNRTGKPNPGADYRAADLYRWLAKRGVAKPIGEPFRYSNAGFGLLGEALAQRAGVSYAELVRTRITEPLGMRDTGVTPAAGQRSRVIPAYDARHRAARPWELDALAGAGAIYSTAGDLLTYLDANLHPDGNALPMAETHRLRGSIGPGLQIGMAWIHDTETGTYFHSGAISGYTSHAFFHPQGRYAAVVLVNNGAGSMPYAYLLGRHIQERLAGTPTVSLTTVSIPAGGGILGLIRLFAAYWVTMLAAGSFLFCCVLTAQGVAAQLLPRRLFLRVSSWMQMGAFCLLVSVYFLQPTIATADALIAAQGQGWAAWSPSFWFLGFFQQLNGSPALAPLAQRAWIGLAMAAGGTALAYGLSYVRTLRQIVEAPDIAPGFRGGDWLPRFGNAFSTAIVQFSTRSFLRSRQHRILLAFYLGIAFAITIFLLRSPGAQQQLFDGPVTSFSGEVSPAILAASLMAMGFWVVGVRVVFSIPLDPRARWIFQMTPVGNGAQALAARRRAMLILSVVPAWIGSAGVFLWLWPWRPAAGHLLLLGLLGTILAELCLLGAQKIPFACSYLPGKSNFHLTFWLCIGLLARGVTKFAEFEQRALEEPILYFALAAVLCIGLAAVRRRRVDDVQFEEADAGAIQVLRLDG